MTEDKAPTQSAVEGLVAQLAADLDVELQAAVTRRLGHSQWKPDELKGRFAVRHEEAGSTYFLDGVMLLGVEPADYDELGAAHLGTNRRMVAGLKFSRYSLKAGD